MSHCDNRLSQPLVDKCISRIISTDLSPRNAAVIFTARILFDEQSYIYDFRRQLFAKVKFDLQKEPDNQWRISRIEILEIDRQPADWKTIGRANTNLGL